MIEIRYARMDKHQDARRKGAHALLLAKLFALVFLPHAQHLALNQNTMRSICEWIFTYK